jgi:hypothetical protein
MDGTGSGSLSSVGYVISSVEICGSADKDLVN